MFNSPHHYQLSHRRLLRYFLSHLNCWNVHFSLLFPDLQPNLLAVKTRVLMHLSALLRSLEAFLRAYPVSEGHFTPQFCIYEPLQKYHNKQCEAVPT